MDETSKRLNQIGIENKIWIIYLFLIGLCLYGNKVEKNYFLYRNNYDKEKYRKITIFIFSVAIIIYLYFFKDSYDDVMVNNNSCNQKKKTYNELSFLASTLILISGLIFLYIAIVDVDLDVELAFN